MKLRHTISRSTGAALFMAAGMPFSHVSAAGAQCLDIDTPYTIQADSDAFSGNGSIADGPLRGNTRFTGDASSLVPIVSTPSPPLEPLTFSYAADTVITTPTGTINLRGAGVFERVAGGHGSLFNRVTGGTGAYTGATGRLYYNFDTQAGGRVSGRLSGEVCPAGTEAVTATPLD